MIVLSIVICLVFTFVNGFHGGCNVMATAVSSRTMSPGKALTLACVAEILAPILLGTAVAETIGKGLINMEQLKAAVPAESIMLVVSALLSAIAWSLFTWKAGLPSSSSHALIGGLIGAGIAAFGFNMVDWSNFFRKVVLTLVLTPIIGFVAGYIMIRFVKICVSRCHTSVNSFFKVAQYIGVVFLASSHSTNDAQKSMGIIAIILLISEPGSSFSVPFWVKAACAFALAMGLTLGGWSIVKTIGTKIFRVRSIHSFNAQFTASAVIMAAGFLGSPVSTAHVVSSSIMGTGAGERVNSVNWNIIKNIVISWIITIPCSAALSYVFCLVLTNIVK